MAKISLKGNEVNTIGELPEIGAEIVNFQLVQNDLSEVTLADFDGKIKVLNIFPSLDTSTCSASVRRFNQIAANLENTVVLNISKDLPFAQKRFCGVEGINNAITLSAFRSSFAKDYGLELIDSLLKGLCSRVVLIVDQENKLKYKEQVSDISLEPNYDKAIESLNELIKEV